MCIRGYTCGNPKTTGIETTKEHMVSVTFETGTKIIGIQTPRQGMKGLEGSSPVSALVQTWESSRLWPSFLCSSVQISGKPRFWNLPTP
jgi:hypothetical protein